VEDKCGDEVEGAGARFTREHELWKNVVSEIFAVGLDTRHTASRPDLSLHGMHSGKRLASVTPISSFPAAAASINGVSKSLFLLTISAS
jgi:hypothetical protein